MGIFFSQISSFADPGILFGGVGVPDQSDIKKKEKKKKKKKKKHSDGFLLLFCCIFLSPQLTFYRNGQFHRSLSFFKVPEEVQHFPVGGGVQLFLGGGGGVQLLISYRNSYNL